MELEDTLFTNKGYQVVFGGTVDYGIAEYEKDEGNHKYGNLLHC